MAHNYFCPECGASLDPGERCTCPGYAVKAMTAKEKAEMEKENVVLPYEESVVSRIRAVYSVDDELAILRQRDTKPHEFSEYNRIVEAIKAEERGK